MDVTTLASWYYAISILSLFVSSGVGVYAWHQGRNKARRDEVDEELDQMRQRLQTVERDLHHSPSQQQIQELHNRIGDVHGELKQMSGKLDGINRLADLMNEHLLKEGKRER